ncbi:hypothetical protein AQUCO_03100076v1 [Aquilegia coerulea]|uniref:Uncharacterized protein n=1 Tax=Aquilegia coerulea TaxID=218851 RepID=A0A2G5D0N7_AQUCA|nr:hypothetical protein AQUCO_03100076v1 [Aquilegia coerulea]
MFRSLKQLKIWSRRKKKKKNNNNVFHNSYLPAHPTCPAPLPPPLPLTHSCSCSAFQPSAPPLPSWLNFEQNNIDHSAFRVFPASTLDYESVSEITPLCPPSINSTTTSYQQYMVSSPVYGVPMMPTMHTGKSGGILGCVFGVGADLIRCFCPCFLF